MSKQQMKIVSTFVHNNVTFGLDSNGKYWTLTPILETSSYDDTAKRTFESKPQVSQLLKALGIPQHILGFDYLTTAICLILSDSKYRQNITKILLSEIAEIHNSTPHRVERAIRHAIDHCEHNELYFELFMSQGSITCKQFIIGVANHLDN